MRFGVAPRLLLTSLIFAAPGGHEAALAAPATPAAGPAAPAATGFDEETIRGLPGYRAEMVAAPVFGGQVFLMEAGDPKAPAVVLVHGLGDSGMRDWYPVLPALAAQYHVVAFDLPGFGRSTHANQLYSPERYAEFIHALAGQRLQGPYNLVGHSMGGALSVVVAARFPGDVKRLLLIDAAGMLHRKAYVNFAVSAGLDSLLGVLAGPAKKLANLAEESASKAIGPIFPISPDPSMILRNEFLRGKVLGSPTRIAALAVILENFAPAIEGVRSPTWILWGSDDAIASLRAGLVLQARLPSAQLRVLEGSGHDPMASRPRAVEQFLLEALAAPAAAPWPRVVTAFPTLPARKARCERESGKRFSGDYAEIEIVGCSDAVVKDVRASAIKIRDSSVVVENARVVGPGVALAVKGSHVEITASDFSGSVALDVEGSDLDLAGVELRGQRASVHVGGSSKLIFSVSRAESPINYRYLHGDYEFDIGVEF